jgi:hypothetical protein
MYELGIKTTSTKMMEPQFELSFLLIVGDVKKLATEQTIKLNQTNASAKLMTHTR